MSFADLHMMSDSEYNETGELLIDLIFYTLQSMKFLSVDLSMANSRSKNLESFRSSLNANDRLRQSMFKIKVKIEKIKKIIGIKESIQDQQLQFKVSLNCGDMTREEAKLVLSTIIGGEISQDFIDSNGEQQTIDLILDGKKGFNASRLNEKIERYMQKWVVKNFEKEGSMMKKMTADLEKQLEKIKSISIGDEK